MARADDAATLMERAWATRRRFLSAAEDEQSALIDDAQRELTEAVALCREMGELPVLAQAIHLLANVEHDRGRDDAAQELWEEAVAICRSVGEPFQLAHKVRHLGDLHQTQGRLEQAKACMSEAVELYRSHADPPQLDFANAVAHYAHLEESRQAPAEALQLWREARDLYGAIDLVEGVEQCAESIARLSE